MSEIIWCDNDTAAPVGSNPTPTGSNRPGALWATNHALWVTQGSFVGQPASAVNGYARTVPFSGVPTRLTATTVVNISGTTAGTAGTAGDTYISGILIPGAATPITLSITGCVQDETGANVTLVITGPGTGLQDLFLALDQLINLYAACTVQASAASKVTVWHGVP